MNTLFKGTIIVTALLAVIASGVKAQEIKEVIQPLSKKATKGFMDSYDKDESGNIKITYIMCGSKKDDQDSYEEYNFDNTLKFLNTKDVQVTRVPHADVTNTYYYANVGGTTSFDAASMKLKLSKQTQLRVWDYKKQRYVIKKVISSETIKARNDNGKVYLGYASYESSDPSKTGVMALAKIDSKEKNQADKFYILVFDASLELKENAIDLNGSYSLVFCDQIANENIVMVFAPEKGNGDPSNYVYFQFDIEGKQINKVAFKSPASALLLTASIKKDGNVFLCGTSTESTDPFAEVFSEYAPIYNPGSVDGSANKWDFKWQKSSDEKMDNFHLLKFTADKFIFGSTTPIAEFKTKFKKSSADKGADPYKGKKFYVEQFFVTSTDDYLIAGQLRSSVNLGAGNPVTAYQDVVCFQFNSQGSLIAQYGVEKMNTDKKSEIFEMQQNFYTSADGKSIYWEILEVKGHKGYASMSDALNNNVTFFPTYFPRIANLNVSTSTLGDFKILGDEKFFIRRDFPGFYDSKDKSITYFGRDEDYKQIWIGKVGL